MTLHFPEILAGALLGVALLAGPVGVQAQSVALSGILGSKALLVVDGAAPKLVAPGETFRGVKVIAAQGDNAVLEIAGQRQTARVGAAPVSVGTPAAASTGTRIVLSAGTGGHFVAQGLINARPVQFIVDTGATAIGIGMSDADRIGLDYKHGEPVQLATANGPAQAWLVKLAVVRVNDVEVRDVEAVVTPYAMPFVLLGNSFLTRFQMTRTNEQMVLVKRF
ncbi:MAG: TIGR02281 family clan AA aspartic protease [Burkholderiaceae bacterium]